jgi:thioredoxin-related protein
LIIYMRATAIIVSMAFLLVAASATCAAEPDTRDPKEYFFTHSFGDLPDEMQSARDEGKIGMLLFFESEACPYCEHMRRKVFNQQSVQDWYGSRFVSIAVDIHGDVELKDFDGITLPSKIFSDQRRVFLTPVLSFIDLNGIEIYRHLGMIKTPQEFLTLGKYIEDKHYFDTEYKVFLKSQGMQGSSDELTTPATAGDAM